MQVCSSCKRISEDSAVRCDNCLRRFGNSSPSEAGASPELASGIDRTQVARDIRVIRNLVIAWFVFSILATILVAFVWFMESLPRQPLVSIPAEQRGAASEPR
jgi:hypothetical protein